MFPFISGLLKFLKIVTGCRNLSYTFSSSNETVISYSPLGSHYSKLHVFLIFFKRTLIEILKFQVSGIYELDNVLFLFSFSLLFLGKEGAQGQAGI